MVAQQVHMACMCSTSYAVVIVEFSSPDYSVVENESTGTVTVCLGTRIGSTRQISVIISTSPKTATGIINNLGGKHSNLCHYQYSQLDQLFEVNNVCLQPEVITVEAPETFPSRPLLDHVRSALRLISLMTISLRVMKSF